MTSPFDSEAQTRESVRRLMDLVQVLVPGRPGVVLAIERCVLALVVDEMRQRIVDRLAGLSPEDLSTVDLLTAQLARARGEESGEET